MSFAMCDASNMIRKQYLRFVIIINTRIQRLHREFDSLSKQTVYKISNKTGNSIIIIVSRRSFPTT